MTSTVALVKCNDYSSSFVEQSVREAVNLLGGIDKFIKPNSRVLIKPNLLTAKGPESGIVTHPEVVRAAIHLLKGVNAKIYVGDSPSPWYGDTRQIEKIWEISGIKKVAEQEKVELVRFNQSRWHGKFPLTTWLSRVDYLVSLPKFKTHNITILTGAIKNLFGLIPGLYKIELHKRFFSSKIFARMLVDLYEIVCPTLTIIDGVFALEGDGPGSKGEVRELGLIAAGNDCVSIDSILALIMGLKPEEILTTREAAKRNLGNARIEDIQLLGKQLSSFQGECFKLPATALQYRVSKPIAELVSRFIYFYPHIDSRLCSRCSACIKVCPQGVIKQRNDGEITIDYPGCISCFCCQEICPNAAISIKGSLIAKLLRLCY